MVNRLGNLIMVTLAVLLLSACDSLPRDVRDDAKRMEQDLSTLQASLVDAKSQFEAAKAGDNWDFYSRYAEREEWSKRFDQADATLARLSNRYTAEVVPLVDRNESKTTAEVKQKLKGIRDSYSVVRDETKYVADRMILLRTGYENADRWLEESMQNVSAIAGLNRGLEGVIADTKGDFAERSADIDERRAPINLLEREADEAFAVVQAEHMEHANGGDPDYAKFADAYTLTGTNRNKATEFDASYREDLESLYQEYTTIIRDMKIEYAVVIGRSTWDNCCDGSGYEKSMVYPEVRVSQSDYEYLTQLPPGERKGQQGFLAHRYYSWGSWDNTPLIDNGVWNRLGISLSSQLPKGHDEGMFWLEDYWPVYYHRYAQVNGREVTESDWEEVDESEFGLYADAFGMAIETKKLGMFADEAVEEATPPGAEMVGDSRYGRWEDDGRGGQRWSFLESYAMYHLLFGGTDRHYYSRADYDSYGGWRRERRNGAGTYGWYGVNRTTPVYGSSGSYSTRTASYQASPFGKSGGVNNISPSVRNAGANARARGPAGGGK